LNASTLGYGATVPDHRHKYGVHIPNVDEVDFLKGYKILDFYMGTHSYVYKIMQRSLQQGALKLQLFVNSLTRPAFKWYINLVPRSVHSWQAMAELFHARFYNRT